MGLFLGIGDLRFGKNRAGRDLSVRSEGIPGHLGDLAKYAGKGIPAMVPEIFG